MPLASYQTSVPVVVDEAKCIADKGCTVCVDVCPLDVLRISDLTGKAFMAYDECWYCMPCEADRLHAADPGERRVAIIALANSGDPGAVAYLDRMTSDPDPGVRQQAGLALG